MRTKILFLLLLGSLAGSAQPDTLIGHYRSLPDDTNKLNLLYEKAYSFRNTDLPAAIQYAKLCYATAGKIGNDHYLAKALNLTGILRSETGLHKEGLADLERALELRVRTKDTLSQAIILNNIGNVYANMNEEEKALEFYEKSLRAARSVNDERWINGALFSMAELQTSMGICKSAEGNLYTLISWAQDRNDHEILGLCYKNMALCKQQKGDNEAAEAYGQQALDIATMTEDEILRADVLADLGATYLLQKKNKESLAALEEALEISLRNNYSEGSINAWKGLDSYYRETGAFKEAYKYRALYDSAIAGSKADRSMEELWREKTGTDAAALAPVSSRNNIFEVIILALAGLLLLFVIIKPKNEEA